MDETKKKATADESSEGPRSFLAFLRAVDGGSFEIELGETMFKLNEELSRIASMTSKATGELTIKIKVKHEADGRVDVHTDVATKTPKLKRSASVFWMTKGGNLSDRNPKQLEMNLRAVDGPRVRHNDHDEPQRGARSV